MSRRHFLAATGGALTAAGLAGCTDGGRDGRPARPTTTAAAATAATALVAPGTKGLVDEATYQRRVDAYLRAATRADSLTNPTGVAARLVRARREPDFAWDPAALAVGAFEANWARIDGWQDTRDFDLMYLLWLLELGQGDTDTTRLPDALLTAIGDRLKANRYRYDDPRPGDRLDEQWFWSENHLLIGWSLELLAGERFPQDTFIVTGLTGAEHAERSRAEILTWVGERAELGFFEWHSNVYLLKNISPLLMLTELAEDPEVVAAAALGLDLCLLDLAAHTQNGCYTAPRGRTYKKDKMSSLDEDTFGTAKFLLDDTDADYPSLTDGAVTYFCAATRYRPPQALVDIALDDRTSVVRERHGVYFDGSTPVTEDVEAPYGKDFEDPANLPFWWSLGALGMWPLARVSVAAADEDRLWDTEAFAEINLMAGLNDYDPEKIRTWVQQRAAVINFGFLSEANTYAYRTPAVSLASVLDHRPGEMRDQAHAWQAAIDEHAMVFTNHPVTDVDQSTDWSDDGRPGYWTGEASMPRSAQHERTAIHLYLPAWDEATDPLVWSVFEYRPFTHAYVPQDHFDTVVQAGHWTVAERSGGLIALWSWRAPTWRVHDPAVVATNGMVQPFDLVAEGGADNAWLVEVGTVADDGDAAAFLATLQAHEPEVARGDDGFTVSWRSPSSGLVEFASSGPFRVDGDEQPLADFPRHESPWGTVEHRSKAFSLAAGSSTWAADFAAGTRTVG